MNLPYYETAIALYAAYAGYIYSRMLMLSGQPTWAKCIIAGIMCAFWPLFTILSMLFTAITVYQLRKAMNAKANEDSQSADSGWAD